jgi:hypothetical protein
MFVTPWVQQIVGSIVVNIVFNIDGNIVQAFLGTPNFPRQFRALYALQGSLGLLGYSGPSRDLCALQGPLDTPGYSSILCPTGPACVQHNIARAIKENISFPSLSLLFKSMVLCYRGKFVILFAISLLE